MNTTFQPVRRSLRRALPGTALLIATLAAGSAGAQNLEAIEVANGFASPLYLGSPTGDTERLFIIEQNAARIQLIKNGAPLSTPFLNIDPIVGSGSERGLLGMAFHPDYDTNHKFYVSYTDTGGRSMLVQYLQDSTNPDIADPSSAMTIFGPLTQPHSNHNGGCIAFGPDGFLYYGLGDGGSQNDPGNRAQNLDLFLGKMLRFDVDGSSPYSIPTNPFYVGDNSSRDFIWAYGLRNPWRFSFDAATGDLWIGDVGQGSWEEVDYQPMTSTGGENYGWRCMEGNSCTGLSGCTCGAASLTPPIHEYSHAGGNCSITGGYLYNGTLMPSMVGRYFFGDYCSGRVWSFLPVGGVATDVQNHTADLGIPGSELITSFGEDANGELYIVDGSGGQIWRLQEECTSVIANYCSTSPNSNGTGAQISSSGTASLSANDLMIHIFGAATNQFGLYYYGGAELNVPFGNGIRCVGAGGVGTYRLNPAALTNGLGDFTRHWDVTQPPSNMGPGMVKAGDTWKIQFWFRDPTGGGSQFNLSDGLSVTWCP